MNATEDENLNSGAVSTRCSGSGRARFPTGAHQQLRCLRARSSSARGHGRGFWTSLRADGGQVCGHVSAGKRQNPSFPFSLLSFSGQQFSYLQAAEGVLRRAPSSHVFSLVDSLCAWTSLFLCVFGESLVQIKTIQYDVKIHTLRKSSPGLMFGLL